MYINMLNISFLCNNVNNDWELLLNTCNNLIEFIHVSLKINVWIIKVKVLAFLDISEAEIMK